MINPAILLGNKKHEISFWVSSDNHNGVVSNETLLAANQMDDEAWSFGVNLGDVMKPDDDGDTPYTNYRAQYSGMTNHSLSDIYHFTGNHDRTKASDPAGEDFYFKKYLSPVDGDNAYFNDKPYPVTGTYDAYYISVGNMIVLCVGDRNGGAQPGGESGLGTGNTNFRAAGHWTTEQWNFLKNTVQNNPDKIIVLCTHQGIKDTIIATGYEEFRQAFTRDENPDNTGRVNHEEWGYVSFINNQQGNVDPVTGDSDVTNEIKDWFLVYGKYIDICLSGHYHRKINDEWAGRTRYAEKYGTRFLNCSVMNSELHAYYDGLLEVKSNMFNISGNKLTIKTYVHKDPSSLIDVGYYSPEEFTFSLKTRFVQ